MKKLNLILMAVIAALVVSCKEAEKPMTAQEFCMSLGPGWNLGNNMDAHRNGLACEDGFSNEPATAAVFKTVAEAGFKAVRIPATWMQYIGEAPDYHVDEARLARVAELVYAAHAEGLKVILNIHHDGFGADPEHHECFWLDIEGAAADSLKNEAIKAKLFGAWLHIAHYFRNDGDWLMFEVMNEIQDGGWGQGRNLTDGGAQYRIMNEWNQAALNGIRAAGGENETRFVGIPGYVTSPHLTCEHLVLPTDVVEDKLLVAVHSYDPWDYAGSGLHGEWGHTGKDIVEGTSEETYLHMLDQLYDTFVAKGVPVYFGEWGCVHRTTEHAETFRKYYMEYVEKARKDRKMPSFFWDNSYKIAGDDAFGLIDHATGEYIDNGEEIVRLIVDTWNNEDPEYTLESIYNRAPQAAE